MIKSKKLDRKSLFIIVLLAVISVVTIYLLAYSTSPLYGIHTSDSSMFAFIGKQWLSGQVPYRDIFDHKGPMIFFIDMLGFILSSKELNGIMYIQMIFLFVSECLIYMLLKENKMGIFSIIIPAAFPFLFDKLFSEWNLTEEYIFPLLMLSYYLIYKYSKKMDEKVEIPPLYVFVFGFTCSFALMTRLTNCIGVACGCIYIAAYIAKHRNWKNLLQSVIVFFIGMGVLILPFSIYFAIKHCSYDFWYGTLIFNLLYTQTVSGTIANHAKSLLFTFPTILCGLAMFVNYIPQKKWGKYFLWLSILTPHIAYFYNLTYYHYFAINIPFLFFAIIELRNAFVNSDSRWKKVFVRLLIGYGVLFTGIVSSLSFSKIFTVYSEDQKYAIRKEKFEEVLHLIPKSEYNSIMLYSDLDVAGNYLDYDLHPEVKYFACQSWHELMNEDHKKEMEEYYVEEAPKYVIKPQYSSYVPDEEWYTYKLRYVTDEFSYYGDSVVYTLYEKESDDIAESGVNP